VSDHENLDLDLEAEPIDDLELLLLSWAQLTAVELVMADEETLAAKSDLIATLSTRFSVTDIHLVERTVAHYVIGFREHNKEKTLQFDSDEVESIYDL